MTLDETLKEEISRNDHLDIVMQQHYFEIGKLCELYGFEYAGYYEYYKELVRCVKA